MDLEMFSPKSTFHSISRTHCFRRPKINIIQYIYIKIISKILLREIKLQILFGQTLLVFKTSLKRQINNILFYIFIRHILLRFICITLCFKLKKLKPLHHLLLFDWETLITRPRFHLDLDKKLGCETFLICL